MSYVQNQAEAMKIQVRLFKEEPFALGHVLHRQGYSQLILEECQLGERLVQADQGIPPAEAPGGVAGVDNIKFCSDGGAGGNGPAVQIDRCLPKFMVDAGDVDVSYRTMDAVFQGIT